MRPEDYTVLGVDPGGAHTGLAVLGYDMHVGFRLHACLTLNTADPDLVMITLSDLTAGMWRIIPAGIVLSMERFVVRGRASRSSAAAAGERARELIGRVTGFGAEHGYAVHARSAAECKRWATDRRLAIGGLLEGSKGEGGHRRDAVRHALMTGVLTYGWPDPLSKTYRSRHTTGDDQHGEVSPQH